MEIGRWISFQNKAFMVSLVFLMSLTGVAADLVVGQLKATIEIPSPSQVTFCGESLWTYSVGLKTLVEVKPNGTRGQQILLQSIGLDGAERLTALGCRVGVLLFGVANAKGQPSLWSWKPGNAGGAAQKISFPEKLLSSPGKKPQEGDQEFRDISCDGQVCDVVSGQVATSRDLVQWVSVPVPLAKEVLRLGESVEENPFAHWQDQYNLNHGRYFRVQRAGDRLWLLDPMQASVVQWQKGKAQRWGRWGVWEGRLAMPKGFARTRTGVLAISDPLIHVIQFFKESGDYIGTLGVKSDQETQDDVRAETALNSPFKMIRFEYPIAITTTQGMLWVADFKANRLQGYLLPNGFNPEFEANKSPDDLARNNLFRFEKSLDNASETRCMICHDGFLKDSLARFASGGNHHPTDLDPTTLKPNQHQVTCTDCHDPHHEGIAGVPHFLKKAPAQLCITCHAGNADPAKNHFGKGMKSTSCTQCHQMHFTPAMGVVPPKGDGGAQLLKVAVNSLCLDCHGENKKPQGHPQGNPVIARSQHSSAPGVNCVSCHSIHHAERSHLFAREATCLKCHGPIASQVDQTPHITALSKRPHSQDPKSKKWNPSEKVCLECHDPHKPQKRGTSLCLSCHVDRVIHHSAMIVTSDTALGKNVRLDQDQVTCMTCHEIHPGLHPSPRRDAILPLCAGCHGGQADELFKSFHQHMNGKKKGKAHGR